MIGVSWGCELAWSASPRAGQTNNLQSLPPRRLHARQPRPRRQALPVPRERLAFMPDCGIVPTDVFTADKEERMKQRILHRTIFTVATTAIALASFSIGKAVSQEPAAQPQSLGGERARIVVDDQAGVIRFEIDGQEAARIDSEGLKVKKHVEYGGHILDVGLSPEQAAE